MNLEIAPSHGDEGLFRGLLGNFDRSTENDLTTKGQCLRKTFKRSH